MLFPLWSFSKNLQIEDCKSFDYNLGALKIAHLPKMCICTKAINVIYYHFHENVHLGKIAIYLIATSSQLPDVYTKSLTQNTFVHFWKQICGW